ncbi:uncharacterized protein L201_005456 [Kwoniella dendrophila CBS 6074]|uniref:GH18 domain-containing protein n=1 Tax=Kwoniella dendrophila CBS 6074 TaxID=1295534 RepID=A0AAX4JYQ0_9TREE
MDQLPIVGGMLSSLSGTLSENTPSIHAGGKRMIGYFTNWETSHFPPSMIPVDELTHLNYAFAKVNKETGEVTLSDPHTDTEVHFKPHSSDEEVNPEQAGHNLFGCLGALYLMKKHNRNLKVMLSIGGATFSTAFENIEFIHWRNSFVQTAVKLVEDLGLDGLDIDFEFPKNEQQAGYYAQLIHALRLDLDELARRVHQPKGQYLLSIAAPCGEDKMKIMQNKIKDMDHNLDFWNLMAYDFAGSWSKVTDHQANLFGTGSQDLSVDKAVKFYQNHGVNSSKLVIGMPLYGRTFEHTHGMGKPFNGSKTIPYMSLPPHDAKVHNDTHLGASYCYDAQKKELISYDTPQIAKEKTEYIEKHNLGGAMFWELAGDKAHNNADSLVKIVKGKIGNLEKRQDELKYPNSKYDNLKGGMSGQ